MYINILNSYIINNRIKLGKGEACFRKAVAAVKAWKTFDVTWCTLCYSDVPVEVGSTIAIMVYQVGQEGRRREKQGREKEEEKRGKGGGERGERREEG